MKTTPETWHDVCLIQIGWETSILEGHFLDFCAESGSWSDQRRTDDGWATKGKLNLRYEMGKTLVQGTFSHFFTDLVSKILSLSLIEFRKRLSFQVDIFSVPRTIIIASINNDTFVKTKCSYNVKCFEIRQLSLHYPPLWDISSMNISNGTILEILVGFYNFSTCFNQPRSRIKQFINQIELICRKLSLRSYPTFLEI